jgi:hypothetical protein
VRPEHRALRPTSWGEAYVAVQCLGGIAGTGIAHLMFDLAPFAIGTGDPGLL